MSLEDDDIEEKEGKIVYQYSLNIIFGIIFMFKNVKSMLQENFEDCYSMILMSSKYHAECT